MDITHAIFDTDTLTPTRTPNYAKLLYLITSYRALLDGKAFTSYELACLVGEYAYKAHDLLIQPLHIGDLLPLGKSRGMTEWGAKILITYGYIPGAVLPDSRYWLPRKFDGLRVVDARHVDAEPHLHKDAVGFVCAECERRKPASDFRYDERLKGHHSQYCLKCEPKTKTQKRCQSCGDVHRIDSGQFRTDERYADGLEPYCIRCERAYNRRSMQRARRAA